MTSRLDRLEKAGIVRRLPDPDDRRSVVVELTPKGRDAWDEAANVQGRREAFIASRLTKQEQRQLNALLRKLLLGFEPKASSERAAKQAARTSR
jgi:DNA-binding MarR family transcriptional regulator